MLELEAPWVSSYGLKILSAIVPVNVSLVVLNFGQ